jgi:hypothetical protein
MKRILAGLALITGFAVSADAAQLVLPSVVITMPGVVASQTPVCVAAASLVAPVAIGTVAFSCTVPPTGWVGTVAFSGGAPFSVTPLVGNTFNVVFSVAITAATTFPAPGTITTTP